MSAPHNGLLLFPLRFAILCAEVGSLEGSRRFGYTQVVRGRQPRGPRPAAPSWVFTSDTNTLAARPEKRAQGEP